jgi:hypothetical protein
MTLPSGALSPDFTSPAVKEVVRVLQATEQICQRLENWILVMKNSDPAITVPICNLVQVYRTTIQQCSQSLADYRPQSQGVSSETLPTAEAVLSQNNIPSVRAPNQDALCLEGFLLDECKRRATEVASRLDKLITQTSQEEPGRDSYETKCGSLDNVLETPATFTNQREQLILFITNWRLVQTKVVASFGNAHRRMRG